MSWVKFIPLFLIFQVQDISFVLIFRFRFFLAQVLSNLFINIKSLIFFRGQANLSLILVVSFFNLLFSLKFIYCYFIITTFI